MTTSAPRTTGDDAFVIAYEALRAQVLEGTAVGRACGLLVLLRQGAAAWMARSSVRLSDAPPPLPPAAPAIADEQHATLVRVLASMVLFGQQEVHA